MSEMNEVWDAVDIIELVGLTEEVERMKLEKGKRHRHKNEIYEMPDDWEVEKKIDFVRERWNDAGLPTFRRCMNEGCPELEKYGEPAYWVIRSKDVEVEVKYIDQYDLVLYTQIYPTEIVTSGIYCPFCKSLGQLVYEKEVENIIQKFIDFSEEHNGDYLDFMNSLIAVKREIPFDVHPPKKRGLQLFEWKKHDTTIDLCKLKESRFIPPLDCEFKSCNYYEAEDCDHLKCVIGEIIWNRLQSESIVEELLK